MSQQNVNSKNAEEVVLRFRKAVSEVATNLGSVNRQFGGDNAATLLKKARRAEDRATELLR